jgi:hypothetical protein
MPASLNFACHASALAFRLDGDSPSFADEVAMKFAALLLAVVAMPAVAQVPVPAPTATSAAKFTLDTPVETIAADPAGKAVLNADIPGLLTHPMYDSFKGMGLLTLQGMAEGKLTDKMLAKTKADLAAIK